jgi:hypothetical protein
MPTTSNPVLKMLKADHKKVQDLFAEYQEATPRKQQDIAQTTIQELEIHAGLEEKLIYRRQIASFALPATSRQRASQPAIMVPFKPMWICAALVIPPTTCRRLSLAVVLFAPVHPLPACYLSCIWKVSNSPNESWHACPSGLQCRMGPLQQRGAPIA